MSGNAAGNLSFLIDQWLYALLAGDATLSGLVGGRIFQEKGRPAEGETDVVFPFVRFAYQSEVDTNALGTNRVLERFTYVIEGVDRNEWSYATLAPIARRIDTLVQGASGEIPGLVVAGAVRISEVRRPSSDPSAPNVTYRHAGGMYRIHAHAA